MVPNQFPPTCGSSVSVLLTDAAALVDGKGEAPLEGSGFDSEFDVLSRGI